jgi:SAM-dependent methyltransferase
MSDRAVMPRGQWPKVIPPLTEAQQAINDDFVHYWHEVLPRRFGIIEQFNHRYPLRGARKSGISTTLEIGAGRGAHLAFEDLSNQDYYCVELRDNMADSSKARFPGVNVVVGDCQEKLPFDDNTFDRVIAIHVLEHLPRLPDAVAEVARVLKPDGVFAVVLPCDPGLLYRIARRVSAERIFRKRYNQSYDWFISREHINSPAEILQTLGRHFKMRDKAYFPFLVPLVNLNLCIGLLATPRGGPGRPGGG